MSNLWFQSKGKVVYDPPRPGLKKKPHKWCILQVDREITRFFRWQVDKEMNPAGFESAKLCQPSWDAHVSIVRGELDLRWAKHPERWKEHDGKWVDFYFNYFVRQTDPKKGETDDYWFVDVICDFGTQIREELGLRTDFKFHLTIGRTWD